MKGKSIPNFEAGRTFEALVQINELTKVRAELKEENLSGLRFIEHPFAANLPPEVATAKERLVEV